MTCEQCAHWHKESPIWGRCDVAKNGTWFRDRNKHGTWMARHTNARYRLNRACKTRFKEVKNE